MFIKNVYLKLSVLVIFALITWNIIAFVKASTYSTSWGEGARVTSTTDYDRYETNPQVISDGTGGSITVWQDNRSGNADIYAQRNNSYGNAIWYNAINDDYEGNIVASGTGDQSYPQIVSDGVGGAIIVWYNDGYYGLTAQRIDSNGDLLWGSGIELNSINNQVGQFQVNVDANFDVLVTWLDYRDEVAGDVYAQKILNDGTIEWTIDGVAVTTQIGSQTQVKVITDNNGGAIISWLEDSQFVYVQKLDALGVEQWTIDTSSVASQYAPDILADGYGGFFLTWRELWKRSDLSECQSNSEIFVQYFDGDGLALWVADTEITNIDDYRTNPKLASDGLDGIFVVWDDARRSVGAVDCSGGGIIGTSDLYAQRVANDGTIQWTANGIIINPIDSIIGSYWDIKGSNEDLFVAWKNNIQKLDGTGTLTWDNLTLSNYVGDKIDLSNGEAGDVFATWGFGSGYTRTLVQKLTTVFQIQDLSNTLDVIEIARNNNIEMNSQYGVNSTGAVVRLLKSSGSLLLADVSVSLPIDRSWPGVSGDSDVVLGKSFVSGLAAADAVTSSIDLYIPKKQTNDIYICPGVTTFEGIAEDCEGVINKSNGDADVSIVNMNGRDYFKVTGLGDAGGGNRNVLIAPVEGLFALDANDPFLYNIDPVDGTVIYPLELNNIDEIILGGNGLAVDPITNEVYAVLRYDGESGIHRHLVTIDLTTGDVTEIGDLNEFFAAIAFNPEGLLYGITGFGSGSNPQTLFSIDKATAGKTEIMTLTNGDSGQAIIFNPLNGLLYHSSGTIFESVNVDTEEIIDIPLSGDIWSDAPSAFAIDSADPSIFYVADAFNGVLSTVNISGTVTVLREFSGEWPYFFKGLAFRTVDSGPEPTIAPTATTAPTETPLPTETIMPTDTPTPTAVVSTTPTVVPAAPTINITNIGSIANIPTRDYLFYYFTSQTPYIQGITEVGNFVHFKFGSQDYSVIVGADGKYGIGLNTPQLPRGEVILTYYAENDSNIKSTIKTLKLVIGSENFPIGSPNEATATPAPTNTIMITPTINVTISELPQTGDTTPIVTPTKSPQFFVNDENGKPLVGAIVTIDGKKFTSDSNGKISLETKPGTDSQITIEYNGKITTGKVLGGNISISTQADASSTVDTNTTNYIIIAVAVLLVGGIGYMLMKKRND